MTALVPRVWDPANELGSRDRLEDLQGTRLRATVARLAAAPFWRHKLEAAGVDADTVTTPRALAQLPFTTKAELRASYPLGAVVVPTHAVVRALTSSGTTGAPTACVYTRGDLALWVELVARGLAAVGIGPDVAVHVAYPYGLTTGAPGFQAAAEHLGARVVPAGVGDEARQLRLLADLDARVLLCTPTYALTLLEAAERAGVEPRSLPVTAAIIGGEPAGQPLREHLAAAWGVTIFEAYGLSEILGPGVANACGTGWLHLAEDHFVPEIVDPVSGRALPIGERGELVLTTVTREAQPLLRYRTGDLTRLVPGICPCGRTLIRMDSVRGRIDDQITWGGRTFFPLDIEDIVHAHPGFGPVVQLAYTDAGLEVRIEGRDDSAALAALSRALERVLGVRLPVRLVPAGSLPRSRGKATRGPVGCPPTR